MTGPRRDDIIRLSETPMVRTPGSVRLTALLLAAVMTLGASACTSTSALDGPHRIVFEGVGYRSRGFSATIPPGRLSLIGTTTAVTSMETVDRADVYAIEGIDPAVVVVARLFYADAPDVGGDPTVEWTGKNTYLFLREGDSRYPREVCVFFDPDAIGVHGPTTPEECR